MSGPPFKDRFWKSSTVITHNLRDKISKDVDYTQTEKRKPICLKMYHVFSMLLPPLRAFPDEFKHWYNINVLDLDMKDDLQRAKVINWCRTAKPLYPLKTTADGNCLLHAVSLSMWGIEDEKQFLRRLLYIALAEDVVGNFQKRWLLQTRNDIQERPRDYNVQLDSHDWKREWESIINAASDVEAVGTALPYATLESIHLYVVANILRRPVIVLADHRARNFQGQSIQENNLRGIYLPLEWNHSNVSKCPLIIGYNLNHFAPMVSQENMPDGRAIDGEYVVPLVMADQTPLPLKFLLANEEPIAEQLLEQYLKIRTIPLTMSDSILEVAVARIEHQAIHDEDNIVAVHRMECERIYRQWVQQEFGQTSSIVTSPTDEVGQQAAPQMEHSRIQNPAENQQNCPFWPHTKCITADCEMFGSPSTANMCSNCFKEYTIRYNRDEEMARRVHNLEPFSVGPSAPPPSIPPQPSGVFLSMLPELCKNRCGLRCSVHTFPYCHECYALVHRSEIGVGGESVQQPTNLPPGFNMEQTPAVAQQGQIRKCKNDLCPSPAAENCDNYCRQCFDKMDEKLFGEGEENLNSLIGQKLRPESPGRANRTVKIVTGSSPEMCTTPNCKGKAVRGKCAHCIINTGPVDSMSNNSPSSDPSSQTYVLRVPSDPGATGGAPLAAMMESPSTPEAYQYYKCKSTNCRNFADQRINNGYCVQCSEMKSATSGFQPTGPPSNKPGIPKHFCPTPGCDGVRLQTSPYCLRCTNANRHAMTMGQGGPAPAGGNSHESQLLESSTPSSAFALVNNPIVTSSREKRKCASPICKNLIYPPKTLCDYCTEILRQNHAKNALSAGNMQEERRSRSLEMAPNSPVRYGPSYSPSRQKCLAQGCTFYGDKKFNGYCSQCYQKGLSKTAAITHLRPTPQLSQIRRNTVPIAERARTCVEPGCDRYGDPSMYYRCTEHFNMSQQKFMPVYPPNPQNPRQPIPANIEQFNVSEREPVQIVQAPPGWLPQPSQPTQNQPIRQQETSSNQEQGYFQAMAKVEDARKIGALCKTNGCQNFGNSKSEGFCNSCYERVQRERLRTSPSHGHPGHRDEYQCC